MTALVRTAGAAAGEDLRRIVRINEEVKAVVAVAFRINLMALNAIFLAKRAGINARGFGVLSNELRVFSQDLRTQMQTLTAHIHAGVRDVSVVLQDIRNTRLLRAAVAAVPARQLDQLVGRRERANAEHQQHLASLRRQLQRALEDAFQLVELGGVLAKSAKIEAAYGQGFAGALTQVSGEFDGVVEEIRNSLQALQRSDFFKNN
jgi:methyl-accepting chemotaxis protein